MVQFLKRIGLLPLNASGSDLFFGLAAYLLLHPALIGEATYMLAFNKRIKTLYGLALCWLFGVCVEFFVFVGWFGWIGFLL